MSCDHSVIRIFTCRAQRSTSWTAVVTKTMKLKEEVIRTVPEDRLSLVLFVVSMELTVQLWRVWCLLWKTQGLVSDLFDV